MSARPFLILLLCCLASPAAWAFPPAPHCTIYGTVRDQNGRPLGAGEGNITLSGASGAIAQGLTDPSFGVGINYTLRIPMDAGTAGQLYEVNAMRPLLPFTVDVVIGGVHYVPIQMNGKTWGMGNPGQWIRLDLTLGVDANNDGLPDAWQQAVVNSDKTGKITNINQVGPNVDLSGNGLTNMQKFLLGVSALDTLDGVKIDVVGIANGVVHLRMLAVTGRTYTLKSSADSVHWSPQDFSSDPTGANPASSLVASAVGAVDVYVTWASAEHGYFQLFAQ